MLTTPRCTCRGRKMPRARPDKWIWVSSRLNPPSIVLHGLASPNPALPSRSPAQKQRTQRPARWFPQKEKAPNQAQIQALGPAASEPWPYHRPRSILSTRTKLGGESYCASSGYSLRSAPSTRVPTVLMEKPPIRSPRPQCRQHPVDGATSNPRDELQPQGTASQASVLLRSALVSLLLVTGSAPALSVCRTVIREFRRELDQRADRARGSTTAVREPEVCAAPAIDAGDRLPVVAPAPALSPTNVPASGGTFNPAGLPASAFVPAPLHESYLGTAVAPDWAVPAPTLALSMPTGSAAMQRSYVTASRASSLSAAASVTNANSGGTFTWLSPTGTGGYWSNASNWVGGVAPTNDGTSNVVFSQSSNSTASVLDMNWNVATVLFNSTPGQGSTGGIDTQGVIANPSLGATTLTIQQGITNNSATAISIFPTINVAQTQTWDTGSGGLIVYGITGGAVSTKSVPGH